MNVPALLLDPSRDPLEAARWTVTYLTEFENLMAEARDADEERETEAPAAEHDGIGELVARWIKFAPMNADVLQALHHALPALGYTLKLSDPRAASSPRTYLRVLRRDGKSAGTLTSTSFTFMGARHDRVVQEDPRVTRGGRYPYLALSTDGALDLVLDVAGRFATG